MEGFEHPSTHVSKGTVTIRNTNHPDGMQGALTRALADLGGLQQYITPHDNVILKVNISSGFATNPSSYTNPKVVEFLADQVARICDPETQHCATPYFAEADNVGTGIKTGKMERFGYMDLIDRQSRHGKPNIPFVHLTTGKLWTGKQKLPWNQWGETLTGVATPQIPFREIGNLSTILLDPKTKIISMSKGKHHYNTGISIDSKNMYGSYPTSGKNVFHLRGIEKSVATAVRVQPPVITISDWAPACVGWLSPIFCEPFNLHKIVASNHYLCGDDVGRELLGIPKVDHLQINERLTPVQCNLAPHSIPIEDAKNPEVMARAPPEWFFKGVERLMHGTHYIPPPITRLVGSVSYPLVAFINGIIASVRKDQT